MKKIVTLEKILIAFSLGIGTLGYSQTNDTYERWDTNNDSRIDNSEFRANYGKTRSYSEWLSGEGDGIGENDWNNGTQNYYDEYDPEVYGTFEDWDTDGNSIIDENEYYDTNFNRWDQNHDGYVDTGEYDAWYEDGYNGSPR